ncbi:MAG: hypothetical protein ACRDSR_21455 [Pseudonocardiaceae bacterium]
MVQGDEPAPDDPRPIAGMSPNRLALLGMYAALDPQLEHELRYLGIRFPQPLNARAQLVAAAESTGVQRTAQRHPQLPLLTLAFATMDVLRDPAAPREFADSLGPVFDQLIDRSSARSDDADFIDVDTAVRFAFREAADLPVEQRWAQVYERVGRYLQEDLQIPVAVLLPELRSVGDEVVSRVETRFVVRSPRTLAQLVPAVLPQNWPYCNDFFCDLTPQSDRDLYCPGATGGNLAGNNTHWRGVYEERVGSCPTGWFPDTFLIFTWDLSEHQLILRYELQPRRAGDRTVLRIDEGYLQVDRLADGYEVTTLKYLLFDDTVIPGGGQTLGMAAFQMGWLDYAISQFTTCANTIPGTPPTGTAPPQSGIDAKLQGVLDRCETQLRQTTADTQAQLDAALRKVRCGNYRLDDLVGDLGQAALRGLRDGSRAALGQRDLMLSALETAGVIAPRKEPGK